MHVFHLHRLYRLRIKRYKAHKMYALGLSPEGPDLNCQKGIGRTSLLLFSRETLEQVDVRWCCRKPELVQGDKWYVLVVQTEHDPLPILV